MSGVLGRYAPNVIAIRRGTSGGCEGATEPETLIAHGQSAPDLAPTRRAVRPRRRLITIIVLVIGLDQLTKALAVRELTGRGDVSVAGGLVHLELYRNFAGSGNRLTGHPELVSLLALAAVGLLLGLARRVRSGATATAVGLMLGGGVSNLLDRLLRAPGPLRGGVVDWLKPAASSGSMNLADVAIGLGVITFVLVALVGAWRAPADPPVPEGA